MKEFDQKSFHRVTEADLARFREIMPGRVFSGEEISTDYDHDEMTEYGHYMPEAVLQAESAEEICARYPVRYFKDARAVFYGEAPEPDGIGRIVVATGGTSDIPVAEEAAVTAECFGNEVKRIYDVGVAGLHRLLAHLDDIMEASVIIASAGMEGALVSVIGGLADCPVIALPTSVGYGASFNGITALLSMLNSCASGVSVVNIDNGFGAGYLASLINHMEAKK